MGCPAVCDTSGPVNDAGARRITQEQAVSTGRHRTAVKTVESKRGYVGRVESRESRRSGRRARGVGGSSVRRGRVGRGDSRREERSRPVVAAAVAQGNGSVKRRDGQRRGKAVTSATGPKNGHGRGVNRRKAVEKGKEGAQKG